MPLCRIWKTRSTSQQIRLPWRHLFATIGGRVLPGGVMSSKMNRLETQIAKYKKEIHADSYPMSIGEVINLYREDELDVHPEFQRFYRWSPKQKSQFIESILLGMPVPSFFVAQREDGVWDVVDGLQRLSTILSFVGELKDECKNIIPELELESTTYLTELQGARWSDDDKITSAIRRDFKREKIDFKIIKKESTSDTKYELFQRLNTGGSSLSDQELRNCLLIMINKPFYEWLLRLSSNEDFIGAIPITDTQREQRYDLELVTRFVVLQGVNWQSVRDPGDVGDFITNKMKALANDSTYNFDREERVFRRVFNLINNALGDDAFRKYFHEDRKHKGAFSIALFEAVSLGLAYHIDSYKNNDSTIEALRNKIRGLSSDDFFLKNSGTGVRASLRMPRLINFGRKYFSI
jgi:hypothetical protein